MTPRRPAPPRRRHQDGTRRPARSAAPPAADRDAGSVAAELAVAFPLLLTLLLLVVQFALWQHAVAVADSAARQGAEAARAHDATPAAGHDAAWQVLDQLGQGVLDDPRVAVDATADTVAVHVTGHAASLLPGFTLPVEATAAGVVERYRPATP